MKATLAVTLAAGAAMIAAGVLMARDGWTEGFEPVGTCWRNMKGSDQAKKLLWIMQTLVWRVVAHLLAEHPTSTFTKDLLAKSKLELTLASSRNRNFVEFESTTGCIVVNLDHPVIKRVPDETMRKDKASAAQDFIAVYAYAVAVVRAAVHALAVVHGAVGTPAHNRAHEFYSTVMVKEMGTPKYVLTPLTATTTTTTTATAVNTTTSTTTTTATTTATNTARAGAVAPQRCASLTGSKLVDCCAAKAAVNEIDNACNKPFVF
jgi:hypothetical protein